MLDSARAREIGRRGGQARKKLNASDVDAALAQPMTTPEAIRDRLDQLQRWACSGLISAGAASAAVRGCEIALRVLDAEETGRKIAALEQQVRQLRKEAN